VRFPTKIFAGLFVALLLGATACAPSPAQNSGDAAADRLSQLVAGGQQKSGWPALRQFAESASTTDLRGQGYFALGYLEFQGNDFSAAADDLKLAAATQFPLADYAEYYAALSASGGKQPQTVVDILDGFPNRHPESVLRMDALALFAGALNSAGQAARAVEVLGAEPQVRKRPRLELLLAQAQLGAGRLGDAAHTFQNVYCNFPTSATARAAEQELDKLRARMGPKFPEMSDELGTTRAEALMDRARYRAAMNELTSLLKKSPASVRAPQWKVDRARCLLHLRQASAALDELQTSFKGNAEADADRMEALVEIYIQRDNQDSADLILDQLARLYPKSPSYASALDAEGNHLVRHGDWHSASRYYAPLAQSFPDTSLGQEAAWRVAWDDYLQKDNAKARQAFVDYATRYPASSHMAADFYWLGRLAEAESGLAEARAFYSLIEARWAETYYAHAAGRRLAEIQSRLANQTAGLPSDSLAADLAQKIPPPPPPADTCPPAQPLPVLRPFTMLTSIGLDDLALQYLRTLVRERPTSSLLFISLSSFEAQKGDFNPSVLDAVRAVPDYYDYDLSALPKETWQLLYPNEFWTLVQQEASANSIDPYLVMALIRQESAFDPGVRSFANARGLMQILPRTARMRKEGRRSSARRLYDPEFNVRIGTDILQDALEQNQGVFEQAMAAYHAGQGRVNTWVSQHSFSDPAEFMETIPIPATRLYVERVVRDAVMYRKLMAGKPVFKKCM
jgi:peptidoglycan lytic transglycosylase